MKKKCAFEDSWTELNSVVFHLNHVFSCRPKTEPQTSD